MPAGSSFSGLAQAHEEKVTAAVAEVIRGLASLAAVFGPSRVHLLPDPSFYPDVELPAICVAPDNTDTALLTGAETSNVVTVMVSALYEEWRATVGVTEPTVRAVLRYVRAGILDNYTLRVAAFSNIALINRIARVGAVQYGAAYNAEGGYIGRVQRQPFVFEFNAEAFTGTASSP
jgi:hypothetical protein